MGETKALRTNSVEERAVSKNSSPAGPRRVGRHGVPVPPPYVVALERLWYSLKVLVVGRTDTDVERPDYIGRDLP